MAINEKMFEALQPGVNTIKQQSGENQRAGMEAALRQYLQKNQPEIAGQEQASKNAANLATLKSSEFQAELNQGGSAKAGDLMIGADPSMRLMLQGPHQAQSFLKTAQGAYKGINDQLDAAQSTLEALNQKNSSSDKLALISEAKLAAGSGGSRAIKSIMDSLSGGKTAGMDYQTAMNYIQNTPSVPVMQDDQRNAIRESVFNRMPQVAQQHQQAQQQLMQQGPIVAPQADTHGLVQSFVQPADQKIQRLGELQKQYQAARQGPGNNPVSQPAPANQNPTTLDRLKSLFNFGGSPQQQQAPAQTSVNHADEVAQELAKRAKGALNQPQAPQGQ